MNKLVKTMMLAIAVLLTVVTATPSIAEVNMQEGNWETTMESKMEGMPFPMPPVTSKVTQCITKKDLVPNTGKKDQKCDIKNRKISGNTVSWKMVCVDKNGTMEGQGEIAYAGNSYQGTVKTKMTSKERPKEVMTSTMKMKGRRLGACPK